MKKSFLSLVVFCIVGASSAFADENVRTIQTRLKQDGFYFGEATGTYDSATAAAVSRYQIRNGLPISGQLDTATAKALGVRAGANVPTTPPNADTWQRLRKTDRQFLEKQSSGRTVAAPKPSKRNSGSGMAPSSAAASKPAGIVQPADDDSTFVLSRERLRDYVAAFVLAGLDPRVGAELEFFGDRVSYYGEGTVGREKIRRDLQRYGKQWPQRRFWLAGQVDVQPQADSRIRVTFPLRFDLRSASKHSSGKVLKTLLLEVTGDDLQIVSVNEQKAR